MAKNFDWATLIAYCGLIFGLSAQEKLPVPEVFQFQDKFLHFGAYFVMGFFAWRAFRYFRWRPHILAWVGLLFCSIYGASDEWHQSFVIGRSASIWDWIADSVGAALAAYLMFKYPLTHYSD